MSGMKTIGVLGGLGPQATMDFEQRVHRVAQRHIPPQANSGYPPMVVFYVRHPPMLLGEDYRPVMPIQADPRLLETAKQLGRVADFLVITANGPHIFQEEIEAAAGRRILSMIDVTLAEVTRKGWGRVGVLGLFDPEVYFEPLQQLGVAYEILDPDQRGDLDRAILDLMTGQEGDESTAITQKAIEDLWARDVEGIILACTEIPLLLKQVAAGERLVNPAQLLAEAAVRFAIE